MIDKPSPSMNHPIRVVCPECQYSQLVRENDDGVPADYVVEHGRETGHILTMESVVDSADTDRTSSVG
jgi:hypothetical protein